MKNYYEILETDIDASKEEIKANYRRLANKYHPDRNVNDSNDNDRFQDINEAQQILLDETKKAAYDLLLSNYVLHHYNERPARKKSRRNGKKRGIYLLCIFIFLALTVSILLNFLKQRKSEQVAKDNAVNTVEPATSNKEETPPLEKALITESTLPAETNKSTEETIAALSITDKSKSDSVNEKSYRLEKSEQHVVWKTLDKREIAEILNKISYESARNAGFSNCIQLRTSGNSNVKDPFEISKVLRNNGYIISGRETVKKSYEGIIVESNGACIKVTIGYM